MMEYYMNHYHSYYSTIASVANSSTKMRNIFRRRINKKGVKTCVLLFLFPFLGDKELLTIRLLFGEWMGRNIYWQKKRKIVFDTLPYSYAIHHHLFENTPVLICNKICIHSLSDRSRLPYILNN